LVLRDAPGEKAAAGRPFAWALAGGMLDVVTALILPFQAPDNFL
jgi:hypothetical protein